jgi:RNA polymerase sigma-70 factor (ECF subfamily)
LREEDEVLVRRARKGDPSAFSLLVSAHEKRIYNLALRMTCSPEDAMDVAQEAFLKAFTSLRDFRGDCSFSTWLYRIASNVCLDQLRKRHRVAVTSLDKPVTTCEGQAGRQVADPGDGPEEMAERREVQDAVRASIESLQPEHRIVILLRDIHGLSYDEISTILNCSLGTVKSRLNRARGSLRRALSSSELFASASVTRGERGVESEMPGTAR